MEYWSGGRKDSVVSGSERHSFRIIRSADVLLGLILLSPRKDRAEMKHAFSVSTPIPSNKPKVGDSN